MKPLIIEKKNTDEDLEMNITQQQQRRSNQVDRSKLKWGLRSSGSLNAIGSCGLYSFCSVSMILANKSLASRYVLLSRASQ